MKRNFQCCLEFLCSGVLVKPGDIIREGDLKSVLQVVPMQWAKLAILEQIGPSRGAHARITARILCNDVARKNMASEMC